MRWAVSSRLPDFPWDQLRAHAETARSHPDGIVDLSVGTPVDPTPELVQRALSASTDAPGYPQTVGLPETREAALNWLERSHGVTGLDLDGLILYDIDDESSRNPAERPFPFSPTVDPSEYRSAYLAAWPTPVIVYRAVGKYQRDGLQTWLTEQDPGRTLTVMVGASSSGTSTPVSLTWASRAGAPKIPAIPVAL